MDRLLRNALRRNLAKADAVGDAQLAERIRARMGGQRDAPAAPAAKPTDPAPLAFASPQAADMAEGLGLGADAFDFEPSGQAGYTVADVRRAAGE
jgi:hypothetical protein